MPNLVAVYRVQYFRGLFVSMLVKLLILSIIGYAVLKNLGSWAAAFYYGGIAIFMFFEAVFIQRQLMAAKELLGSHKRIHKGQEITRHERKVTFDEDV